MMVSLTVQTLGFLFFDGCEFDSGIKRDIFLLSALGVSLRTQTLISVGSPRGNSWYGHYFCLCLPWWEPKSMLSHSATIPSEEVRFWLLSAYFCPSREWSQTYACPRMESCRYSRRNVLNYICFTSEKFPKTTGQSGLQTWISVTAVDFMV